MKPLKTILLFLLALSLPMAVLAVNETIGTDASTEIYSKLGTFTGGVGFAAFSASTQAPEQIIGAMVQYLLSFLGVIFIILVIYAGFLWMTASGDEEQITKAKDIMKSSIMGLIIVLLSVAITETIFNIVYGEAPTS